MIHYIIHCADTKRQSHYGCVDRNNLVFLWIVLQVVENGNPLERNNWFPDIEPLFKLLGYENVPPYVKVDHYI